MVFGNIEAASPVSRYVASWNHFDHRRPIVHASYANLQLYLLSLSLSPEA